MDDTVGGKIPVGQKRMGTDLDGDVEGEAEVARQGGSQSEDEKSAAVVRALVTFSAVRVPMTFGGFLGLERVGLGGCSLFGAIHANDLNTFFSPFARQPFVKGDD